MSKYLPFFETAWIVFQEQQVLFPEVEERLLRPGNHVADKNYPDETLGVIADIEDDIVHIVTPEWMINHTFPFSPWDKEGWNEAPSLVRTEGYSLQELASVIYGSMGFHHYYNVPRSDFGAWKDTRLYCQHEKCNRVAVGVGILNYWGTIMPFAMCVKHTEYHGMRCEHVPFTDKVMELA